MSRVISFRRGSTMDGTAYLPEALDNKETSDFYLSEVYNIDDYKHYLQVQLTIHRTIFNRI